MKTLFERLLLGDENILEYFSRANSHWESLIQASGAGHVELLSSLLPKAQKWFCINCGGETLGKEIMVIVGFTRYGIEQGGTVKAFSSSEQNRYRVAPVSQSERLPSPRACDPHLSPKSKHVAKVTPIGKPKFEAQMHPVNLLNAIQISFCSLELKRIAERYAKFLGIFGGKK